MRFPSASVWTLSLTASAENGAPFTVDSDDVESSSNARGGAGVPPWPVCAWAEAAARNNRDIPHMVFIFMLLKKIVLPVLINKPDGTRDPVLPDEQVGL